MGKNTEIKLIGLPIFKQIVDLIEGINVTGLIKKNNSDHYYKAFKSRAHLITMLFGMLSRCDSMTGIWEGLRAMGGKLNHLGGLINPRRRVPYAMGYVIVRVSSLKMFISFFQQ